MSSESLLNLEKVLQEVYVPLITNPANQDGWGEVMSKNVTDGIHTFLANVSITLAHTKGETSLPMPPMQDFFTPSPPSHNKDRVHLLENAIIIWTKQIKNVLKQDSEQLLKQGLHPGPYEEIKFWKKKSRNLNAIHKQLQSPEVRAVLDFLDRSKSTYCTPFAKLCREIFTAKIEANDNTTFLEPLETWFEALGSGDFMSIRETFRPLGSPIIFETVVFRALTSREEVFRPPALHERTNSGNAREPRACLNSIGFFGGPEVLAQATLINFIATESGLEEQLLARVVNNERPDLEAQKQELQEKFNKYKITLIALEDQLLQRLANAPDDILSDVPLIEGLEETKRTANEINEAVKLGKQTELDINKSRELYRVVASEASMLYFMISTLSSVDAMYQYSLDAYIQFFNKGMRDANNSDDVATRAANLVNCLRLTIYTWVSRGLFEDHKIIFMALITFELMRRKLLSEEIVPSHFDFLIRDPRRVGA
eukprot:Stramenopile-MAST_4_protein_654